ncbi:macrolide ABC transporter ATP-binding protein [candidate division TA06 bacterium DG_26]|uniref:Macrolide ABC transporter ATP-binding protein n=1 Tax=candidate division TA06 bacterium DG_26 TaxID=1703771 RepID=A0A0S7WFA0_UNCT6|nr:MAG: macrolide ABC transporter ATP-binding protein [candidate division TA06 bacterium DG_26]
MSLIECSDVTKVYRVGAVDIHALRGVSLAIEQGEYLSIVGPSGSGKSTLMHILGCLDTPTSGEYTLKGVRVNTLSDEELARIRNREIGFIFQSFNLLPRATVMHNTELPMIYSGVSARERKSRTLQVLEKVGLKDRTGHLPSQLSGGETQRAAIARAVVTRPSLVLADEPTGNLDSRTGEEILELFTDLHKDGNTLIVVTHERYVADRAERIIYLHDGQVVERYGH